MSEILRNIQYAMRQLKKSPGFTAVALLTLALCIGSNLAIFAVVDGILLRPLPFPHSDRLVILYNTYPKAGKERDGSSLTSYYERRGNIRAFSQIASLDATTAILGEAGSTQRMDIARVTPEFFSTLGVAPVMGRVFTEQELTYSTDHEAILTDEYWRKYFNADPNVLGKNIRTDGLLRQVVGVLPRGFRFLSSHAEIFLPSSSEDSERNINARHSGNMLQIARLKPGASVGEAQAEIDAYNAAIAPQFPYAKEIADSGFRTIVAPLHADHVASIRPTLILLQIGALFLLLIGGVNLVNLLLLRASGRSKEIAVRQSMGAKPRHVLIQVMAETVLLAMIGGLCGIAVGAAGIRLLSVLGADQLPLGADIVFNGQLALRALLASIAMGILIALPIAGYSLRSDLAGALQSESRTGTSSRSAQNVRHAFIVIQIASAFVLLAGAGLLGLSLKHVMSIPPGFRGDHVLTAEFGLPWNSYHDGQSFLKFSDRLVALASHQPGISAIGAISGAPLSGDHGDDAISASGYTPPPGQSVVLHPTFGVFGDYFAAMGIPLRTGRYLVNDDNHRTEKVCVVDEIFARRYWPKGNAVGQRISADPRRLDEKNALTVVGVVGAVKQKDLTEKETTGAVYFPFIFTFNRNYFLAARTSLPPELLEDTLRKVVRQADPDIPLVHVRSMETLIGETLMTRRSPALLTGIFSAVALLLAAIGTYGVLSYAVSQRHREIGVRMALGALPKQVLSYFLSVGMKLLLAGIVLGCVGAWATGRAMQSVLFGVGAFNAGVFTSTAAVMMLVVLLACLIPARRAAKVDPMVALRYE